jgi:predicted phage tail protein
MLRKIKLYGRLAKFIGKRVLEADVSSAAEAVRFLLANWPDLERHMADQHYRVSLGDYDLGEDELHDPAGGQIIKFVPVVTGAGATGRIIAGVALVALAIALPGLGGGVAATIFGTQFSSLALGIGSIGASLILGGVSQLITPTPRLSLGTDSPNDPRKSYSFSGIQNTSRQGTPVPIVYGETLVGSIVISAGTDTVQVTG